MAVVIVKLRAVGTEIERGQVERRSAADRKSMRAVILIARDRDIGIVALSIGTLSNRWRTVDELVSSSSPIEHRAFVENHREMAVHTDADLRTIVEELDFRADIGRFRDAVTVAVSHRDETPTKCPGERDRFADVATGIRRREVFERQILRPDRPCRSPDRW